MVNSFTTPSELYRKQHANKELTNKMNLLAIELLRHGQTRTENENWTYRDTAIMNVQIMDALGIEKASVSGTSQGRWITVRMALVAPKGVGLAKVFEGSFEGYSKCVKLLTRTIDASTTNDYAPNSEQDDGYYNFLIDIVFGKNCAQEVREFWKKTIKQNYQGDDRRRRTLMAAINLCD